MKDLLAEFLAIEINCFKKTQPLFVYLKNKQPPQINREVHLWTCVPKAGIYGNGKYLYPTDTVGCDYLSLRLIPAFATQVLNSKRQNIMTMNSKKKKNPLELIYIYIAMVGLVRKSFS